MTEPRIEVGILHRKEIVFRLNGKFSVSPSDIITEGEHKVICLSGNRILWDGKEYDSLMFIPENENCSFDLNSVTIGVDFHWEREETQRFSGILKLIADDTEIVAINRIALEKYLTSVISSEMSASASLELLKAHAVISRSWLLAQLPRFNGKPGNKRASNKRENPDEIVCWYDREDHFLFDVCADDHCQRYQGITRIATPQVAEAVRSTRGEVLTSESRICDARFSKCCGGVSELFENCWEEKHHPYLIPVYDKFSDEKIPDLADEKNASEFIESSPEAFCNTRDPKILEQVLNGYDQETTDFYRWSVSYSQSELANLIRKRSGIDFGEIVSLVPLARGASGRIVRLRIVGTKVSRVVGKELFIRRILSASHLYSSAFTVHPENVKDGIPQSYTLKGAGWGHGVGLCQIGAAVMGAKGYSYREILSHYYRNSAIERIY